MVRSKTDLFPADTQQTAFLFKAMGHPARLAILKYLAETRTCITGDLSEELPLSRTTVNQHLTELKKAGLIQGQFEGSKTKYCLRPNAIEKAKTIMLELFSELELPENFTCK